MKFATAAILSFFAATQAGTVVWDGSFDPFTTPADFDKWSWANQVGTYQWYIHGSGDTSKYLNPGTSYKNPAVSRDKTGLKLTVDSTSHWNGQTMMRTELIPQTKANLGQGQMYYHFSIKRETANGPGTSEHQIMFFESHFTELKVGIGSDKSALNWCINGQSKWSTTFTPGVWYNFAYDINFSSNTVGLWASTGSGALQRVVSNQSASTSTNSQDFHVGVLRLGDSAQEDWYLSGVYIESGSLTTSVGSGSTTSSGDPASEPEVSDPETSPSEPETVPSGPTVAHYGQCGGANYSGSTNCESGLSCTKVNDYYSQCL